MDNAIGEYLFFLDSDDTIHPLLLEALVDGAEKNNLSVSATSTFGISQGRWNKLEEFKAKHPAPAKLNAVSNKEALDMLFTKEHSPLRLLGGVMFKRDYVADTRFNTEIYIGEDFLFLYENLIKGSGVALLEQKWYYCRHHETNSSKDWSYNGFYTRFKRRELVWENEERLGRPKYANLQKRNLIFIFANGQQKCRNNKADVKKMRNLMKKQRRTIIKDLTVKDKLLYYMVVYVPAIFYFMLKFKK